MKKSILTILIYFFLLLNIYSQTQIGYKEFKLGMNRNQVITIMKKMGVDHCGGQDGEHFYREEMHYTIKYLTERPSSAVTFKFNYNDFLYHIKIERRLNQTAKKNILSILKIKYGDAEIRWDEGNKLFTFKATADVFINFTYLTDSFTILTYYNKKIMNEIQKQIEERNRRREQINSNDY